MKASIHSSFLFDFFPDMSSLFSNEEIPVKEKILTPLTEIKQYPSVEDAWRQDFLNLGGDMRRAINNVIEGTEYGKTR